MSRSLLDHFPALPEPRQAGKALSPFQKILLLVLCGTIAGAEGFVEVERRVRRKLDFLRRLLPFARGVPSHGTLDDMMNALPGRLFPDCFAARGETLRANAPEIVAIDGRTSRRAHGRGAAPLHLVSAWAGRQHLRQEAIANKGSAGRRSRPPGSPATPTPTGS